MRKRHKKIERDLPGRFWKYKRLLCSEPIIPFEFHAATEQAFEIAAFARGHFRQEEIELSLMPGPVYRIRRADQAKPSRLARVRKAIWRRMGRIGRELFAVLQGSLENGGRPAEGRRQREVGRGLPDAATAQAQRASRQTEERHERNAQASRPIAGRQLTSDIEESCQTPQAPVGGSLMSAYEQFVKSKRCG
jgi:hypothetical protein